VAVRRGGADFCFACLFNISAGWNAELPEATAIAS